GHLLRRAARRRVRLGARVELRLLVHAGCAQRRVEAVLTRMHADVLRIAKRVANALEPGRLGDYDVEGGGAADEDDEQRADDEASHVRSARTDATNRSSSSSEPEFS